MDEWANTAITMDWEGLTNGICLGRTGESNGSWSTWVNFHPFSNELEFRCISWKGKLCKEFSWPEGGRNLKQDKLDASLGDLNDDVTIMKVHIWGGFCSSECTPVRDPAGCGYWDNHWRAVRFTARWLCKWDFGQSFGRDISISALCWQMVEITEGFVDWRRWCFGQFLIMFKFVFRKVGETLLNFVAF